MATQDARVGAWSLMVTADAPRTLNMSWRDDVGPYDLTGKTVTLDVGEVEYTASIVSNVATVNIPAQTASATMVLRLDGEMMAVGKLHVDPRGSERSTLDVAVSVTPLEFTVELGGPPGATPTLTEDPPGSGLYTWGTV